MLTLTSSPYSGNRIGMTAPPMIRAHPCQASQPSQVSGANEHRPVALCTSFQIFAPSCPFDGLPVRAKHFELVLVVRVEVITQSLPG